MPDYLANLPASHSNVSPGFLETLLQSRREELFNGLMHVQLPGGETVVQLFLDGVPQKMYRCLERTIEIVPRPAWFSSLGYGDVSVFFVPLSVDALRVMQLAHDVPIQWDAPQTLTQQQLVEQVGAWVKSTDPSILHIQADPLNRIYLISGTSNPVIESVSFGHGKADFSVNDNSFPSTLPGMDTYQVIRYSSDAGHETWQEYQLRLAFQVLMRLLLNRFSELAGRMLTERLCDQISSGLKQEGLNIRVSMNGISNHQLFESLETAIDAYVGIIRSFHEEASPAIGLRMAEGLSRDILFKLDPSRRETLMRHIYNQDRLDTATGRVWR